MSLIRPTTRETAQINEWRAQHAQQMRHGRTGVLGPCSPDTNRLPSGELGAVAHARRLAAVGSKTGGLTVVRFVGEKPRTRTGPTGLIHERDGPQMYVEGAKKLHDAGIPFASEVVSDVGAAIMTPHLSGAWIGAREVSATAPRYAVRPTKQEVDEGTHPIPTWVKSGQNGSLDHTINALNTVISDKSQTRTRFGLDGLQQVETVGNPYVGVILRGSDTRPEGEVKDILAAEIGTARETLDAEFGVGEIPLIVDISHGHAKYEGGGEEGQLKVASALGSLIAEGAEINGWMAETYILPGKQDSSGTVPGLSITDPCIREAYAEDLMLQMDAAYGGQMV